MSSREQKMKSQIFIIVFLLVIARSRSTNVLAKLVASASTLLLSSEFEFAGGNMMKIEFFRVVFLARFAQLNSASCL